LAPWKSDRTLRLPGIVVVGNPKGDVTLAEFYDVNCPYCRRAAADLDKLLAADTGIRLVLVPLPVLGPASILAARVEFAVAKLVTAQRFHEFHRGLFAGRGTIDANRALVVAKQMKIDVDKVIEIANRADTSETMKAHVRLADALGLAATPGYVIKDVAVVGHPDLSGLQGLVRSMRACGEPIC
jgi:protein-disulfide isomerase